MSRGWTGRCAVCIISVVVLAAAIGAGVWESAAEAAVDPSLCRATSNRLTVSAGYPLGVCWDGANLVIKNTSAFVLDLTATGGSGTGTRAASNVEAAGAVFADLHSSPSVLPPGYQETVPFGSGSGTVTFSGDKANESYAEFRGLATILPGHIFADYQAVAAFVNSLSTARSNFDQCRQGANFLTAAGCAVALVTAVTGAAAALAVSAGAQFGPGSLGELMALVQTAAWANNAVTDLGSLIDAPKTVTIAAATPATMATTTTTPTSPPANNFSGFVGQWEAHQRGMTVQALGAGVLTELDYPACPNCISADIPINSIAFRLDAVSGSTATGTVTSASDTTGEDANGNVQAGYFSPGSSITLALRPASPGLFIKVTTGSGFTDQLCDPTADMAGQCGA